MSDACDRCNEEFNQWGSHVWEGLRLCADCYAFLSLQGRTRKVWAVLYGMFEEGGTLLGVFSTYALAKQRAMLEGTIAKMLPDESSEKQETYFMREWLGIYPVNLDDMEYEE